MSTPRRKATYDDLCAVPEHFVAEIVDGELVTSPRPAMRHALATSAVGSQLFDRFNGPPGDPARPGGWWILGEPELHLGEDVLVPDLAGWRRTRMPTLPDVVGVTLPPDWICEVSSPTTRTLDRRRKMPIYARECVEHLWLVHPLAATVEVYALQSGAWVMVSTHAGDVRVRVAPFETIELDLARWWERG
jgi:Uma2 family endonuclease